MEQPHIACEELVHIMRETNVNRVCFEYARDEYLDASTNVRYVLVAVCQHFSKNVRMQALNLHVELGLSIMAVSDPRFRAVLGA